MPNRALVAFTSFIAGVACTVVMQLLSVSTPSGSPIPVWRQKRIALHEAGHAVLHAVLVDPKEITKIMVRTVRSGEDGIVGLTVTWTDETIMTSAQILHRATRALAGQAADETFSGSRSTAAQDDVKSASQLVWRMHGQYGMAGTFMYYSDPAAAPPEIDSAVDHDLKEAYRCAMAILLENKATVQALADRLQKAPAVDGERVLAKKEIAAFFGSHPLRVPADQDLPWFCCTGNAFSQAP